MKTLRAILLGVLLWALIFVEIQVTIFGLKLSSTAVLLIHYLFLILFGVLGAKLYYESEDKLNGFLLGLIFVIVVVILDMIITYPLFIAPPGEGIQTNYSMISIFIPILPMFIGFAELIAVVGIYDILRRK